MNGIGYVIATDADIHFI